MKNKTLLFALAIIGILTGCQNENNKMTTSVNDDTGFMKGVNISHYLSQTGSRFTYGDTSYVSEKDFKWLAKQGYDHVRLPVDGSPLINDDGSINSGMFEAIDQTIDWATGNGLNVLLDIHELPGSNFSHNPDSRLFENSDLQSKAVLLWTFISNRYKNHGPELRFEILNEPVSDNPELVTAFYSKLISVIREISPNRVIHVCSNRWGSLNTVASLEPLFPDPNLVVDVHFYEPHIFTHQKAAWVRSNHPDFPDLEFPGVVPDLSDVIPEDHYGHQTIGEPMTVELIAEAFDTLAEWSEKTGIRVYNGEFGAYYMAPDASRRRWYKAVLEQCQKHGIGWAAWDYQGGFAIRDPETGRPTLVHETIEPYLD